MNITYKGGWAEWVKMLRDFQEGKFYQEIKDCKKELLSDLWIINEFPGKDDTGVTVEMMLPVDMYRLEQGYMCGISPAYEIGTAMVIKAFDSKYLDKAEKWLQYTWKLLQRGDRCCCSNAQSLGELATAISCPDISQRIKLSTHCNSFGRIGPPLDISQDQDESKKQRVREMYRSDTWRKFRGFLI